MGCWERVGTCEGANLFALRSPIALRFLRVLGDMDQIVEMDGIRCSCKRVGGGMGWRYDRVRAGGGLEMKSRFEVEVGLRWNEIRICVGEPNFPQKSPIASRFSGWLRIVSSCFYSDFSRLSFTIPSLLQNKSK